MAIERFTADEFRAALPCHKETGAPLWKEEGFVDGELCFLIEVRSDVFIAIRSSVRESGAAAPTGKDSIRAWLVGPDGTPIGNKLKSHTTREKGWQDRMTNLLRELYRMANNLANCPDCGKPMGIFVVKKKGKNQGRKFAKCMEHGHFKWVSDPIKGAVDRGVITPWSDSEMTALISDCKFIKDRRHMIKEAISRDEGALVYALMYVFEKQTYEEKLSAVTIEHNKVGFSGVDAEILTSFAEQFRRSGYLSEKQLILAKKKLPKYANQIERLLREQLAAA